MYIFECFKHYLAWFYLCMDSLPLNVTGFASFSFNYKSDHLHTAEKQRAFIIKAFLVMGFLPSLHCILKNCRQPTWGNSLKKKKHRMAVSCQWEYLILYFSKCLEKNIKWGLLISHHFVHNEQPIGLNIKHGFRGVGFLFFWILWKHLCLFWLAN